MEYQKFIPEGWENTEEKYSLSNIKDAIENGKIMQGFAYKCDDDYNIHVKLNENIEGIIPRNEIEYLGVDENGNTKTGICKNKINNYVQFKVKSISDNSNIILSRKDVCKDALEWANSELDPGMIVKGIVRNIRPYGVFVEIGGGVVGLIHIQDISISFLHCYALLLLLYYPVTHAIEQIIMIFPSLMSLYVEHWDSLQSFS